MIISVVMKADDPVKFGILRNVQFCVALGTLGQGLSGIFFHLDKEEFSVSKKHKKLVMRSLGQIILWKIQFHLLCRSFTFNETIYVVASINEKG